jgi:hypothetical protein
MPLSTPLVEELPTVDFATRLAKAVAMRSGQPTYVTSAVSLSNVGGTHNTTDDVEAFRTIVDAITAVAL